MWMSVKVLCTPYCSTDSSVFKLMTEYKLKLGVVVWFPAGATNFSVLQSIQTGSEAHPTFDLVDIDSGYFLPVWSSWGVNFSTQPTSGAEFHNKWSNTSTPSYPFMVCIGTTFSFTPTNITFCIVMLWHRNTRYDQEKTGLSAQRLNQWTEHTATSGDD